jgi:hypothetical protein
MKHLYPNESVCLAFRSIVVRFETCALAIVLGPKALARW